MRPALLSTLAALSGLGLTQLNLENVVGEIIGALGIATTQSQGLMAPANQLSVLNAPLVLIGTGPWATIITGFTDIIATITSATSAVPPTGQFTASDELAITDAFSAFSAAEEALVGVVVQAGGAVRMVPAVGPLVASAVQDVLVSVDVFADALSGSLGDGGAGSVMTDMGSLRDALEAALGVFS